MISLGLGTDRLSDDKHLSASLEGKGFFIHYSRVFWKNECFLYFYANLNKQFTYNCKVYSLLERILGGDDEGEFFDACI